MPAYTAFVAQKVAEFLGKSIEEKEKITTSNAKDCSGFKGRR